jgi:hypothetical protein
MLTAAEKYKKYPKKLISIDEKDRLMKQYVDRLIFERKVDIHGCCIRLWTDDENLKHMWGENWYLISENIRSHGRIVAIGTGGKKPTLYFDPISKTVFFFDCNYYGWIKSAALALAGDILEDNHDYYSIHGALIDYDGKGISIIGPSGTGKTTLSYGLLRYKNARIVADDWHFFKLMGERVEGYASEKNSYIRADLALSWPEYKDIYQLTTFDKEGRGVIDVRRVLGRSNVKRTTDMKYVFLLRREKGKEVMKRLTPSDAVQYMERTDYCNPHLLQNNSWKKKIRRRAFLEMFRNTHVYLLNTIETPQETLDRICSTVGIEKELRLMLQ